MELVFFRRFGNFFLLFFKNLVFLKIYLTDFQKTIGTTGKSAQSSSCLHIS